jgi:hypothetical protein
MMSMMLTLAVAAMVYQYRLRTSRKKRQVQSAQGGAEAIGS